MPILISEKQSLFLLKFIYHSCIYFLILLNTIFLGFNSFQSPLLSPSVISKVNIVFNFLALGDLFIKLFVLGFKTFLSRGETLFYSFITIISLVEIWLTPHRISGFSSLYILRLLMLLQIGKVDKTLRKLIDFIKKGKRDVINYFFILFIFFSMCIIIGRLCLSNCISSELVTDDYGFYIPDNKLFRANFNSYGESIMTIIILFFGDVRLVEC